ncbi:MAG: ADP-ribosylglycohydrolase family protein, partial [Gammaproteobacteria bacterium]|nr:ADP-ribosylglycohydrolase family protein [Gammaproteobacteria bacterium]
MTIKPYLLSGLIVLVAGFTSPCPAESLSPEIKRIDVEDYQDRVFAAWLGQIVGNIYGLSYEFRFIDEPGPDEFPYGFGESLERVRQVDGAFSDDDTDIEYMYLLQMEEHGFQPSYRQLAEAWKHHVRDRVWVANRNALTLMHAGYGPPLTGSRDYNPNWFQIDPQLVNEIWAVTAPGMVDYAAEKSAWAARITNDGFGIEPTIHYAAMYAAAFFERDVDRLIDIGTAALPAGSRFAAAVEEMKALHRKYPEDWQQARREMAARYYGEFDYNRNAWPVVDAVLNGAAGILALLYGEGDFQRTLDLASAMGFDADNQAATMSGLLGIVLGSKGIPENLLFPLGRGSWEAPFNDRYINVSRHDLPDASIRDMARRTARQGENVILAHGGRIVMIDGRPHYEIAANASFSAPFEIPDAPTLLAEIGKPFGFSFFPADAAGNSTFGLRQGELPPGLEFNGPRFEGTPTAPGSYRFRLEANRDGDIREQDYVIRVLGRNLAQTASGILINASISEDDVELIRDGSRRSATFYNRAPDGEPRQNHYGYRWDEDQTVSTLVYNP